MLKVWRFVLAAGLLGQGAAFAQITVTSAKPTPSASTTTATTATAKPANTGEIYRWVDKGGKVQYSAEVPEDRRATARKVDTRSNIVSSKVPASISGAEQAMDPNSAPLARQPSSEREKCEAIWQRYKESEACFAKFRQATASGGGNRSGVNVSAEALEKCQSMPEPKPCR